MVWRYPQISATCEWGFQWHQQHLSASTLLQTKLNASNMDLPYSSGRKIDLDGW
jgi:hypothetical protein